MGGSYGAPRVFQRTQKSNQDEGRDYRLLEPPGVLTLWLLTFGLRLLAAWLLLLLLWLKQRQIFAVAFFL